MSGIQPSTGTNGWQFNNNRALVSEGIWACNVIGLRFCRSAILLFSLVIGFAVSAHALATAEKKAVESESPPANNVSAQPFRQQATAGTKHALIICGHPGDDEHRALFAETVVKLHKTLTTQYGFPAAAVRIQFGSETVDEDDPALRTARGQSTREEIEAEVADLRKHLKPEDTLWVIVLGHAHYDGRHAWLNLPGPDMHQNDFGRLFSKLQCREQLFLITTPVSGFYLAPLSAKGRIVISATEADREVNETIFPLALTEVLSEPPEQDEYDADKDGMISVFDLYIAIARNIATRYLDDELLSTEHAQLDDNGDGRATELQLDYLTEDQGGRSNTDAAPKIQPGADGSLAARVKLPLVRHSDAPVEAPKP